MRTLYIIRHAKSDWSDMRLDDHDRPLNTRGRAAALVMGRHLQTLGIAPELVLCSTAVRARQTLDTLKSTWGADPRCHYERRLYEAGSATLMDLISRQSPKLKSLMLVGHNPGLQDLAIRLTSEGEAAALERLHRKVPTGTFIEIALDIESFDGVREERGRLLSFIRPKTLT